MRYPSGALYGCCFDPKCHPKFGPHLNRQVDPDDPSEVHFQNQPSGADGAASAIAFANAEEFATNDASVSTITAWPTAAVSATASKIVAVVVARTAIVFGEEVVAVRDSFGFVT
jgi:hypothetical protein